MNVVLLITVTFTLVLVQGSNDGPCVMYSADNDAYTNFALKHIYRGPVPTNKEKWETYLKDNGLCYKGVHTFFKQKDEGDVKRICNGDGENIPYHNNLNLCISKKTFWVCQVTVRNSRPCIIDKPLIKQRYVIVACDLVGKPCRPVHFERSTYQLPYKRGETCRP